MAPARVTAGNEPTERTALITPATARPTSASSSSPDGATANGNGQHAAQDEELDPDRPLPRKQILLLAFVRTAEPIGYFSIFAYAPAMVRIVGKVPETDIGFWTGAIESALSLVQMCVMIPWGRAADTYGRKPVLAISMTGVAISMLLFGFSRNLWQMMLTRCIAGLFAGSVTTLRAMFTEHSTPKTQARAFSFFSVAGNVGIFLGPFVGGLLADPVQQYPKTFGDSAFLKEFPFILPSIAVSFICLLAVLVTIFFVEETYQPQRTSDGKIAPPSMSTWELVKQPGVGAALFLFTHILVLGFGYTAILPIFWYTRPSLGGYGFSPQLIALFLGFGGLCQALWLLLIFPPLQRRIGTGGVLRLGGWLWPISPALMPLWNYILKKRMMGLFWAGVPLLSLISTGASMSFTASQLAVNAVSPTHQLLGTLNALAMTLASFTRAVSPALFASLYATGVHNHILSGQLAWVVFLGITLAHSFSLLRLIPPQAEKQPEKVASGEDVEARVEEET